MICDHSQSWSVYQKHMSRNIVHQRCRQVVPSHCLHSAAPWMQRWLDHHPGWVWLLVPCQMHRLGLSLVSSCWSTLVLCPHIPIIWVCQMRLDMWHSNSIPHQSSEILWMLLCEKIVAGWMVRDMLPFQGSSEALFCSMGQASPWWHWTLIDLDGLHVCHKYIQRTWQSCSWLHTSSCSVPVHVLLQPSWTCVVSCYVLHHPYDIICDSNDSFTVI